MKGFCWWDSSLCRISAFCLPGGSACLAFEGLSWLAVTWGEWDRDGSIAATAQRGSSMCGSPEQNHQPIAMIWMCIEGGFLKVFLLGARTATHNPLRLWIWVRALVTLSWSFAMCHCMGTFHTPCRQSMSFCAPGKVSVSFTCCSWLVAHVVSFSLNDANSTCQNATAGVLPQSPSTVVGGGNTQNYFVCRTTEWDPADAYYILSSKVSISTLSYFYDFLPFSPHFFSIVLSFCLSFICLLAHSHVCFVNRSFGFSEW